MDMIPLKQRPSLQPKVLKQYDRLNKYVNALAEKSLTDEFIDTFNTEIEEINAMSDTDPNLSKHLRKVHKALSTRATKLFKFVPKNYYLTLGMSIGMAAFGIPFGVMFSVALDSYAFIGLGLPIGMSIGMALGAGLDKKAAQNGRQLTF